MSKASREAQLNRAFVLLADTLTHDYDVIELLNTLVRESVDLFDAQAGGIMIVDGTNELHVVVSTSEKAELVEFMQLDAGAGPCVQAFTTGAAVIVPDVGESGAEWSQFREEALRQGFHSLASIPLRLRGEIIGTMNLMRTSPGKLNDRDLAAAQALADVATIGILQERLSRERGVVGDQLYWALDSRVLIEQAKGVLSAAFDSDMDESFHALRSYARSHQLTLRKVAAGIVDRSIHVAEVAASARAAERSAGSR
ncbi:MAG TPA: GAF and ANTAR domain-containing protein [Glaciihabitans sp.]|jgi:GAF domain-containing protein|nr:GAF and ANTAR domain-containing protein [Glaciihabitans sp.]